MRWARTNNDRICCVSNQPFEGAQAIPDELSHVSDQDLILCGRVKDQVIHHKAARKPAHQLKVAVVSNWKATCGLSSYMEYLLPELSKHVQDFKLFIERNDNLVGDIWQVGEQQAKPQQILPCWRRGEPLQELVRGIKEYCPDIVLINHEWGIFPDPKHWLSFLTQLSDYRVITIMHSVFPNHLDKIIVEASMGEIVVHLEGAKQCLQQQKNVGAQVYVIPHGCYPMQNAAPLWNIYRSDHTVIQSGFGLRYKNFSDSIKAVAILKDKYPDIYFTAIFSETPFAKTEHERYYQELVALINQLGAEKHIGIVRGYQSDTCLDAYFRTNKIGLFPYQSFGEHFVYGASGACRLAMSKSVPVITSSIPHFSDIPSIKADTPEEIATALDRLFSDKGAIVSQLEKQRKFVEENSWANIARQYIRVFEG